MKTTRRRFIKITALSGAALALPRFARAVANSNQLKKWIQPIRELGSGGIPVLSGIPDPVFANTTFNQITVGEFTDQLHPQRPDTRQILRIKVITATTPDPEPAGAILNPNLLDPPAIGPITTTVPPIPPLEAPAGTRVRDLTLNETFDAYGRLIQMLGTTTPTAAGFGLAYEAFAVTELVAAGSTEVWRIFNTTADTHPKRILRQVALLGRPPRRRRSASVRLSPLCGKKREHCSRFI